MSDRPNPAQRAEHRARQLQRASFRDAIKDPEARQALVSDPAFREMVQSEVAAERARQDAAQREREQREARRRAQELAPRVQQRDTGDIFRSDPMHNPAVIAAAARGDWGEVARLRNVIVTEQARARQQHQEREAVMWETRNGPLMADNAYSVPVAGPGAPGAAGLPPKDVRQQRSEPLPDPKKVRADREADS